jgi:PAS domain S-box-containing protein
LSTFPTIQRYFWVLLLSIVQWTASAEPLSTVNLQLKWLHQFQFAGYYAALEKGFYRDVGLNVVIHEHTRDRSPLQRLRSGEVEYIVAGSELIVERSKGVPVVALSAITQHSPLALLVTKNSGIKSPSDLRDKRVMTDLGLTNAPILAMLKKFLKENEFIHQKSSYKINDLIDGKTDAFNAYVTNQGFFLKEQGIGFHYLHPTRYGIDFYDDILATTEQEITLNPQRATAFREASLKGWRYALDHSEEIVELILKKYNSQEKSRAHLQYEAIQMREMIQPLLVNLGYMHRDRWIHIQDTLTELGFLDQKVAIEELLYLPEKPWEIPVILIWLLSAGGVLLILSTLWSLTIRKQRDELSRFKHTLDLSSDCVFMFSPEDYRFIYVNDGATAQVGFEREELLEMTPIDIKPEFTVEQFTQMVKPLVECPGLAYEFETLHRHKDGHDIPVEVTLQYIAPQKGAPRFVAIVRDISERNEFENNLRQAKEQAEHANYAKDDFLASMSHELRTPLTIIMGNSELLSESGLNQNQQENIQTVMSASYKLLSLVNDILDLSKIESGKFEVDLAPFDLTGLLEQLKDMYALQAKDAGVHFEIQQKEYPQFQLWGDFVRIGQILLNLLSNAFKFTDQGSITLTCWREGELLNFSVEDSGIGMPPEVLDRLFQPFEQADSSISRRYGGTGLGLHISWSLAELLDGSIEVVSEEGKGSQFTLKLPYRESELHTPSEDQKQTGAQSTTASHQYRGEVLVVEDTPELQLLESRLLKSMGATVTLASDGQEAVEKASQQHFDLILMDMQMPVMNGLEATRVLREQGSQTPIAALTANVMQRHRDQFYQAGVDEFLQKPINKSELQQTLNKYLKQEHTTLDKSTDTTETTQSDQPQCGEESLCPILVIDDEERMLELYRKVLGGRTRDSHGDALQALEGVMGEAITVQKQNEEPVVKEFSVTVANQGKQGVELAQQAIEENRAFPVAFIDMQMPPGMDGLETAKALRALDKRIYIVIVTAYSNTSLEQINEALRYDVLYVHKPFDRQEILQMARILSQNWKNEHQGLIGGAAYEAVPSGAAEEEVDDELIAIFNESATNNKRLLMRALAEKEWKKIKEIAHPIKGSGTSFGFPELTAKAKSVCDAFDNDEFDQLQELTMDLILELGKALS